MAVLALGHQGISEARVMAMSRPELDAWLAALAKLNAPAGGGTAAPRHQYVSLRRSKK